PLNDNLEPLVPSDAHGGNRYFLSTIVKTSVTDNMNYLLPQLSHNSTFLPLHNMNLQMYAGYKTTKYQVMPQCIEKFYAQLKMPSNQQYKLIQLLKRIKLY